MTGVNWFVVGVSVMYTGAFAVDVYRRNYVLAVIWFGYAVSGFALAKVGGTH